MNDRLERLLRSRSLVLALIVLPGLWPLWPVFVSANPTVLADPGKYLLHHLGFVASILLAIVLVLTPLRVLLPRLRPVLVLQRHRRLIGVSVFVYAALHVAMQFVYQGGFGLFADEWRKPFILVGLAAFALLTVLAASSFDACVRWLGARRWKRLHRLVYIVAMLVVYHQISARKVFPVQVLWIYGPVLLLELMRLARTFGKHREESSRSVAG